MTRGTHSGAATHHQLQLATGSIPMSFKERKRRKIKPVRLIPEEVEVDCFDMRMIG